MPTTAKRPTIKEQQTAKSSAATLKEITEASGSVTTLVFQVEGKSIPVPGRAVKLLEKVLEEMGDGNSVRIASVAHELTTQEAADHLNVSRPHLVKLLETGKIPFKKVGSKRKVLLEDVQKYDKALRVIRRKNLELLAQEAQEMKLGYE